MSREWLEKQDGWKETTLVWDIETTKIKDGEIPVFRVFGAYSYKHNQYFITTNEDLMFRLLKEHDIYITYNGKDFDLPVLYENYPFLQEELKYKFHTDMLEVLKDRALPGETRKGGKGRAAIIGECRLNGINDNRFENLKLATVVQHIHKIFDLDKKGIQKDGGWIHDAKMLNFDYGVLDTDESVRENWDIISTYLKKDIIITKELFEFLDVYFNGFKDHLSTVQANKLQHINSSTGAFAYKAMCNDLGFEEEYGDGEKVGTFLGAFVQMPTREIWTEEDGDGYCVDFASQHPHHQWCANLFTPIIDCQHKVNGTCPNPYKGDGKIFKLQGTYCGCEIGRKEKWLRSMYFLRLFYKRKFITPSGEEIKFKNAKVGDTILQITPKTLEFNEKILSAHDINELQHLIQMGVDPREYAIKIIINSSYGISSSPGFKHIYTPYTGADTTTMSRQSTAYMKKIFEQNGYKIAYGDTDSLYIFDPFKDKNRMKIVMAEGINDIRKALPFPDVTYNMDIDASFTHMFFFPDLPKTKSGMKKIIDGEESIHYRKKNYVYITTDNKVKLMGLPIIKGDASILGKRIFIKYLYQQIQEDKTIKFDKEYLQQLIDIELEEDPLASAVIKKCNSYDSYVRKHKITLAKAKKKKLKLLLADNTDEEALELVEEWMKDRPDEPTGLQAQLAKEYGEGKHYLIKNSKYGFKSAGGFYAKIYDKYGNLTQDAEDIKADPTSIDIEKTWSELSPFLETDNILEEFKAEEKAKLLAKEKKKLEKLESKEIVELHKEQRTLLADFNTKKVLTK